MLCKDKNKYCIGELACVEMLTILKTMKIPMLNSLSKFYFICLHLELFDLI